MPTIKTSVQLTERFKKGLENYDISIDELQNGSWFYCGGNRGRHLNYFKLSCPNDDLPSPIGECVCGHAIQENCYITNGTEIIVMGNCCIKRFVSYSSRTCDKCKKPHRNRKVNLCNNCRQDTCLKCDKPCGRNRIYCWLCR